MAAPAIGPETDSPMRLGLLITRFPDQTSISMWRVGAAMRELGVTVEILSTRKPDERVRCHPALLSEADSTYYAWPAPLASFARRVLHCPLGLLHSLRYLAGLHESGLAEKLRLIPVWLAGAALAEHCHRRGLQHVLVHSCANAAHLINFAHAMGGPPFSLRLGGDLDVYGKDHRSKMAAATMIFPAARVNQEEITHRIGIEPERMRWTTLGVDSRKFRPADRSGHEATNQTLTLLTVARLNRAKGHHYVIDAMGLLRNRGIRVNYVIAGGGPYEPEIRDQIESVGLQDQVSLVGPQGEQGIVTLLQSADLFVLASTGKGEASPVAVIEAMSCGVPVICSNIGGTPEIVSDGEDGLLVPQHDAVAIADAIERLHHAPDLRNQMSLAARRTVESRFDCALIAQGILRAIDRSGDRPVIHPRPCETHEATA